MSAGVYLYADKGYKFEGKAFQTIELMSAEADKGYKHEIQDEITDYFCNDYYSSACAYCTCFFMYWRVSSVSQTDRIRY